MLKREIVRGIVIPNTCVKLYRKWIINEVARAGEHTNERRYVRTYSHTYVRDRPYIPSTTLLCEGIITEENKKFIFGLSYFFRVGFFSVRHIFSESDLFESHILSKRLSCVYDHSGNLVRQIRHIKAPSVTLIYHVYLSF